MKLLLLVQSPDDVAHLNSAARSIVASSITGVWVVFSPAVLINATDAAAKLDSEIDQLRAAERQAADRSDYAAASGYKTQREGKELDRAKVLRDAWKTISDEDRKTRTEMIFEPFKKTLLEGKKGINLRVTAHSDHYEREQWVAMLNSLSGVWFKPFAPGSFVIGWPESVETSVALRKAFDQVGALSIPTEVPSAVKTDPSTEKTTPLSRRDELMATHHMSLKPIAKSLSISVEGMTKVDMVEAILAAEAGVTAPNEPALAEY
jgi:hypothetical protein